MIPAGLEQLCDPSRLAVIVYDMQVGVVSQVDDGPSVTAAIKKVLDAARLGGYRIFFTRHMWLPNRFMGVGQLRRSLVWHPDASDPLTIQPPFKPGTPGWQIVPELAPADDDVFIDKITMSAFQNTFLELALRDAGMDAFGIMGIAMEVGIEPTVRHACDLNFIPIVVTDACGYRDDAAQRRAMDGLAFTGEVIFTDSDRLSQHLKPM